METTIVGQWDTWVELLLGGAIIRHGTEDWNVIAVELRDRIPSTYTVTPEVCKCKYEDLQKRYSKSESTALYEELRNTRMVETKKSLEQSKDSIRWGSREEALLSAAVDRHGFQDWNVIATELQKRAVSPYTFTPEVCKVKYENLQQRYSESDSKTLLEKLTKTRIIELKKSLERSEDSIGSLQTNLEFLKAEKDGKKDDYENGSRNPLSHVVPSQKVERVESSTKETSNETTRTNSSIFSGNCKKQRGKRKRKDYNNMNEASVGDSADDDDVDSWWKKSSTCTSKRNGEAAKSYTLVYDPNRGLKKHGYEDMSEFLGYLWIGGMEWSRVELNTQMKRKKVGRPKTKLIHQRVGAKTKSLSKEALTVKKKVGRPRKFVDGNSGQKPSTPMKGRK